MVPLPRHGLWDPPRPPKNEIAPMMVGDAAGNRPTPKTSQPDQDCQVGQLSEPHPGPEGNPLTRCKNHCWRCSTKNAPQNKNSPRAKTLPVQQTMLMVSGLDFMACSFSFVTKTDVGLSAYDEQPRTKCANKDVSVGLSSCSLPTSKAAARSSTPKPSPTTRLLNTR